MDILIIPPTCSGCNYHMSFLILGPLTILDNHTKSWVVVGIANWAFPRIQNRTVVAGYARVEGMLSWIHSVMHTYSD